MSKEETNKVTQEDLLNIIDEAGLDQLEQKAYFKCTYDGNNAARIYVAKTKKVTRVDLAGFTITRPGVKQISREEAKEERLGNVQAQLDFSQDADVVLTALTKACEALKAVPKPEPKAKKETKPAETEATEPVEEPESEPSEITKEERRELIKKAAETAAAAQ